MLWKEETFISFDLETSGAYPLHSEICEIGAVKWKKGEIVDQYVTFIKPTHLMDNEIIAIHGITNEMVQAAPRIEEKINEFYQFIEGAILIAHHAPFDMGFLAVEFEKAHLPLPTRNVICTSLLSRKVFPDSPNHKLVTLRKYLNLKDNTAHRAYDDAYSCLELGLKCFEKLGEEATIADIYQKQGGGLGWERYSFQALKEEYYLEAIIRALLEKKETVEIIYLGGSQKGKWRTIYPCGLVRNPKGDYLIARDEPKGHTKRFYLSKIQDSRIIELS